MKIAVEGCAHGELEKIYDTIESIQKAEKIKIDLLLCCGDFQSTRNLEDLETMAVPKKYMDICTFYKYYSGEKIAPVLTIFIGGNHEASNYLQELPYGGWVAPNIYYMGYAGVVKVNGIRIAGLSGIYKSHDFFRGRHEFSPYSEATKKSVYHVRQLDVFRLKQLSGTIDICMSHDWPKGIYNYGNKAQLVRFKPHFKDEIETERLGSRPCEDLLNILQPSLWFAAHLHCKFAALVPHEETGRVTKFLALDKCLPKRRFLQVLDIDSVEHTDDGEIKLEYDLEWLTILFLTNHLISVKSSHHYMPGPNGSERYIFTPTDEEKEHVHKKLGYDLKIPENFCRTVEAFNPNDINTNPQQPKSQINPQSLQFCDNLGIDDPLSMAMIVGGHELSHSSTLDGSDLNDSGQFDQSNADMNSSCDTISPLKRKSNLCLPKPVGDLPAEASLTAEQRDSEEMTDISPAFISLTDDQCVPVIEEIPNLNAKPPMKKFKRRNEDIYKTEEDEEEL
ncbi:lariat debranching enzyme [Eupeodes corollae]|uniref:lariat debranching enzyme n=1 Tax=Eupeodes corollae TaxID=290404 RepID=UPI0024924629|nr:lariat debranching enzyme [Eupeodes corollae]